MGGKATKARLRCFWSWRRHEARERRGSVVEELFERLWNCRDSIVLPALDLQIPPRAESPLTVTPLISTVAASTAASRAASEQTANKVDSVTQRAEIIDTAVTPVGTAGVHNIALAGRHRSRLARTTASCLRQADDAVILGHGTGSARKSCYKLDAHNPRLPEAYLELWQESPRRR